MRLIYLSCTPVNSINGELMQMLFVSALILGHDLQEFLVSFDRFSYALRQVTSVIIVALLIFQLTILAEGLQPDL